MDNNVIKLKTLLEQYFPGRLIGSDESLDNITNGQQCNYIKRTRDKSLRSSQNNVSQAGLSAQVSSYILLQMVYKSRKQGREPQELYFPDRLIGSGEFLHNITKGSKGN